MRFTNDPQKYVGTILNHVIEREEYEYRDINDLASTEDLLKQLILESSCKFNTDICKEISKAFFKKWKINPEEEWSEK